MLMVHLLLFFLKKNSIFATMKKIAVYLTCLTILLSYSCSNDFDLVDDWKDITVAYGILSPSDTAHYVKVEKAFLDEATSAVSIAQIPDSIYYSNIVVNLVELTPSGGAENTYAMTQVDANLEGYVKPAGAFANSPNYVYKTTALIDAEKSYRLEIENGDTNKKITATTNMIPGFNITRPISILDNPNSRMKWVPGTNTNFRWQKADNAAFYDLTMEIAYTEYDDETPAGPEDKVLVWEIAQTITPSNQNAIEYGIDGGSLYQFLANQLIQDERYCRQLGQFTVRVDAGGEELYSYINVGAANVGITGTLPLPIYTNLSDGRGVFSCRNFKETTNVQADGTVITEILENELTKDLGFIGDLFNCQ